MESVIKRFILPPEGLPNVPLLMLITLEALKKLGGSASIQELVDQVIEQEQISDEEQSYFMPNGRARRINYYLAWARTHLKRGKALENSSRGVWAITESGEKLTSLKETQAIYDQVYEEERQRTKEKQQSLQPQSASEEIEEVITSSDQTDSWKDELLRHLGKMTPDGFERLAQRLLREAGFVKVEVRGKTGDDGIDGVGILRVNLVTFQVYFQCKRWVGSSVGSKEIRDFRGALQGRADKGLFITTATFTKSATEEATRDGAIAIDLIDGDRLCDLMKDFELAIKTELVEKVTIDPAWLTEV